MLQSAIDAGDYGEADGLKARVERLRSQHPIIPREERLTEALQDENYVLAAIFQEDLDSVKSNLGLPKYDVGQAVVHSYREGLRGIIIDVDLQCMRGWDWVQAAGCLERGCALGYPGVETERKELQAWANQPFYWVLPDLTDRQDELACKQGMWKWAWPPELAAFEVHHRDQKPAPLYLPEDALAHDPDDETDMTHGDLDSYFGGHDTSPHRGRVYRPKPKLRLWQKNRAAEQQEILSQRRKNTVSSKNPYDAMK